jgi:hypothetical protein
MRNIKTFESFKINENNKSTELYRLTTHSVVDLSQPGEFYFSDINDVNPDFLENQDYDELFLITVKCDESNIDAEKSEKESAKLNCDCIVVVKDDKKCEVISVEPYNK